MKQRTYASWPLLLVPALFAFATVGEDLSLSPEKGLSLTKSFVSEAEMSLDESSTMVNGQDMDMGMDITVSAKTTITVSDEYGAFEDGRPATLKRTFDELSSTSDSAISHPMMGDMETSSTGSSELEGLAVLFTWDGDAYETAFAEGSSGDEDLLEGLEADLDFGGLLPDEEISEGSTWSIDPQVFRACVAPGGSTKIEMESEDEGMMGMGSQPQPSPDSVYGDFEGEVTAKLSGIEEEDGVRVAVVHLEIDISTAKDMTDLMVAMMEEMDLPEEMGEIEMDIGSFDMEFAFDGGGEFRWNLEAGVLHSLELTGEVTQTVDTSMSMGMAGQSMEIEDSKTMSGNMSLQVTVEVG